jgi:hypothetical protein
MNLVPLPALPPRSPRKLEGPTEIPASKMEELSVWPKEEMQVLAPTSNNKLHLLTECKNCFMRISDLVFRRSENSGAKIVNASHTYNKRRIVCFLCAAFKKYQN